MLKNPNQAKGIWLRNNLTRADFENSNFLRPNTADRIDHIDYNPEPEVTTNFGPISAPAEEYIHLPADYKYDFIGKVEDLHLLEKFKGDIIGVDAEWKPTVHPLEEEQGPAIF
mmetsp:Transcript_19323/g.29628  ORF Transcript_19323/g.29628 Transcript_19323/m.29628 type:complete len:113 (+) Transcript_19323:839-1177(+)